MRAFVRITADEVMTLHVPEGLTVLQLKEAIQQSGKSALAPADQRLFFFDRELNVSEHQANHRIKT